MAKSHSVPADILFDVLHVLFTNNVPFNIQDYDEQRYTLDIQTITNPKLKKHKSALDNIKTVIEDYNYYRHEHDVVITTNWNDKMFDN